MKEMMNLPYSYNALEPDINSEVLFTHFDKHYRGYVDNLNKYLKEASFNNEMPLEEIPGNIEVFPIGLRGDILYNVGGVLNHELYFKIFDGLVLTSFILYSKCRCGPVENPVLPALPISCPLETF